MGIEQKWDNNNEDFDAVIKGHLSDAELEKQKNETAQIELLSKREELVNAIANTDDFARKGILEEELQNLDKKMESVDKELGMAA